MEIKWNKSKEEKSMSSIADLYVLGYFRSRAKLFFVFSGCNTCRTNYFFLHVYRLVYFGIFCNNGYGLYGRFKGTWRGNVLFPNTYALFHCDRIGLVCCSSSLWCNLVGFPLRLDKNLYLPLDLSNHILKLKIIYNMVDRSIIVTI